MKIFATILAVALLGTAQCVTISDVSHSWAGVVDSIQQEDHSVFIFDCIKDIEELVIVMTDAVEHFVNGEIMDGLQKIDEFVKGVFNAIDVCLAETPAEIRPDFSKTDDLFAVFANLTLLDERISANLPDGYTTAVADYRQAMTYYFSGDFFNFGHKIGEGLVAAIGEKSATPIALY